MAQLVVTNVSINEGVVRIMTVGTTGRSGYSGYSGKSGYSGYSGTSGYSGANPGASGYSGYSGKSGFSGYSGRSGFSGYSGAGTSGYSGYSGPSGFSGYSGISGYSGYSGKSGFSGYSGLDRSALGVRLGNGVVTVAGSTTTYGSLFGAIGGNQGFQATETLQQVPLPYAGTAKNFYVVTSGAQPGDGTLVLTIRKNAADTAVVITIAAAAPAGTYSDTTHSASFSAGDLLSASIVNNSGSTSAQLVSYSLEYDG